MSVSTLNSADLIAPDRERGFLSRLGERLVSARLAQAEGVVAEYLLSLDDETLDKLGYERSTLLEKHPRGYPFL